MASQAPSNPKTPMSRSTARRLRQQEAKARRATQQRDEVKQVIQSNQVARKKKNYGNRRVKTSGGVQTFVYKGAPIANIVIERLINDIMFVCQIGTLNTHIMHPTFFSTVSSTSSNVKPAELAAYGVLAVLQAFADEGLLNDTVAGSPKRYFPIDAPVPRHVAEYINKAIRVIGTPVMEGHLDFPDDLLLAEGEILPPGTNLTNNLCFLQAPSNCGFNNWSMFAVTSGGGSSVGADSLLAKSSTGFSGLLTGSNPFYSSARFKFIAAQLKKDGNVPVEIYSTIPRHTKTYTAFLTPVGDSSMAGTDWCHAMSVESPSPKFDVETAPFYQINLSTVGQTLSPFPLGYAECVPHPTLSSFGYSSTGTSVPANQTWMSQNVAIMLWMIFNSSKTSYSGFKGNKGYKIHGFAVTKFCRIVGKPVDTYNMVGEMVRAYGLLFSRSVQGTLLTTDLIAAAYWYATAAVARKVYETGQLEYCNLAGSLPNFPPQALVPPKSVLRSEVLLLWKIFLDEIGVASAGGTIYVPMLNSNTDGTLMDDTGTVYYYNWPKTGLVNPSSGHNVCRGASNNFTPAFPFVPFDPLITTSVTSQAPLVGGGPNVASGSGTLTPEFSSNATINPGGNIYVAGTNVAANTSLAYITTITNNATAAGFQCNFIHWQDQMPGLIKFLNVSFKTVQINKRGVIGQPNNTWGGPSMLAMISKIPAESNITADTALNLYQWSGVDGVNFPQRASWGVHRPWRTVAVWAHAPLSRPELTQIVAIGLTPVYRQVQAGYPLSTAYSLALDSVDSGEIVDGLIDEAIAVDSEFIEIYSRDVGNKHTEKDYELAAEPKTENAIIKGEMKSNCARRAVMNFFGRIGGTLFNDHTVRLALKLCDETADIIGSVNPAYTLPAVQTCLVAREIFGIAKSVMHHYDGLKAGQNPNMVKTGDSFTTKFKKNYRAMKSATGPGAALKPYLPKKVGGWK